MSNNEKPNTTIYATPEAAEQLDKLTAQINKESFVTYKKGQVVEACLRFAIANLEEFLKKIRPNNKKD